jgi:hypothetical protein
MPSELLLGETKPVESGVMGMPGHPVATAASPEPLLVPLEVPPDVAPPAPVTPPELLDEPPVLLEELPVETLVLPETIPPEPPLA